MEKLMQNDTYKEHDAYHQSFHRDCSTCFSERIAQQKRNTNLRKDLGESLHRYKVEDMYHLSPNPLER